MTNQNQKKYNLSDEELTLLNFFQTILPNSKENSEKLNMWQLRAYAYINALLIPLLYLKRKNKINLNIETIREHLDFYKTEDLAKRSDIPLKYRQELLDYIQNLPFYKAKEKENLEKHDPTVLEQHAYITMQFTEILKTIKL